MTTDLRRMMSRRLAAADASAVRARPPLAGHGIPAVAP